jgi:hypothetical protein
MSMPMKVCEKSPRYGHLPETRFDGLDDFGHHRILNMTDFVVVNIPYDGTLLPFDDRVGDTGVIRVQLEAQFQESASEQIVPQH